MNLNKPKETRKIATDPKRRRTPVTISHLILLCAGMVLMFLLQLLLPQKYRWFSAASDSPETADTAVRFAGKSPWGDLQATPIALARPDAYFTNIPPLAKATQWFIPKASWTALTEFIESLNLDGKSRSFLKSESNWQKRADGFECFPPGEVVLALSPTVRSHLYNELAQAGQNTPQRNPFRFRQEGFGDWFNESGLSDEKVALVKRLLYTNEETICFADLPFFSQASTPAETLLLLKSISRVPTYMLRLRVDPEADVDSLLKYWAPFGNARDAKILFRSISRADSDISISYFLPALPRLRLYTYPRAEEPRASDQDEIWTAMNFFNATPDNGFFDDRYAEKVLYSEYVRIATRQRQFGDLVVFVAQNKIRRMCVQIAGDFVFTKSGRGPFEPWLVTKTKDLIKLSLPERPFEVKVYRPKVPPRFAMNELDIPALD